MSCMSSVSFMEQQLHHMVLTCFPSTWFDHFHRLPAPPADAGHEHANVLGNA